MVEIILKNLTKRFGEVVAVNDVSLTVNDKEFVILLGPSGCGKTTTLRCIAGLETPDEGEIYLGDTLVNDFSPKDRDLAMVFQSYALYPHMTVFDNIAFPLKMRKVPKDEIRKRVKETAELLHISHLLDRKPKQLSGGEAQRTALGRAIVRQPKAFLMDEPLSNLDAKLRLYMRAELKRIQRELGITTVYVTHDQAEAMTMADKIAIMNQGLLQQIDPPHMIYNKPLNKFIAGFIGSPPMNFIDCSFNEKDGKGFLETATFTLPIPDEYAEAIKKNASGSEVVLGFRPEDVGLGKEKISETSIQTNVYVVEPLGSEQIVNIKLEDTLVKVRTSPTYILRIGDEIWIDINMDRICIFDKKTERSLL